MNLLPWQQKDWTHLVAYSRQDRVPQALLIHGNKGLGKLQLASQFAFSLLCEKPGSDGLNCDQCDRCLLLKAETHPDFIQIKPEEPGKSITIGQIRSLITRLTLKPQFDTYRVVTINPADLMNNAASNAFLKCLEEPTERTILVLITDNITRLPATIISRCQKLNVSIPNKETVITWLKQENSNLLSSHLETLFNLTQGSPLQALAYSDTKILTLRNDCFNAWLGLAKQQQHPVVLAENWHKLTDIPLLHWMATWTVDMMKCYYQQSPVRLYNPDLKDQLQWLSQQLELKVLYSFYDLILISQQRYNTQINKQSLFEEILIKWFEANRGKTS